MNHTGTPTVFFWYLFGLLIQNKRYNKSDNRYIGDTTYEPKGKENQCLLYQPSVSDDFSKLSACSCVRGRRMSSPQQQQSKSINSSSNDDDPHVSDPLPPGWTRQYSKSNAKYFYHHKVTGVTQWHFPTASEARDPKVAQRRAEEAQEREKKRTATSTAAGVSSNSTKLSSDASISNGTSTTSHLSAESSSKRQRTTKEPWSSNGDGNNANSTFDLADKTCVAIIVPYRDIHVAQQRAAHLQKFIPHMISFLNRCKRDSGYISDYHIYIVEQSDDARKFNRGKLLNIGFDLARKSQRNHDVFVFHDVDLLPDDNLQEWYTKFPKFPIHIARVWDRYSNNPKYFGGVVSFSSSDYKRINGVCCVSTLVV
jgi:N-terminal region of glycosyl transferase group 7/WW domain/N-terminal domain of galactosyltransferase